MSVASSTARPAPFRASAGLFAIGALGVALGAASAAGCSAPAVPPNVLLLTVDTLRADHLEPYGYGRPTSPELARFAAEAVVFEAAQAQSSWTLPTLATLMTGTYPSNHRVLRSNSRVESSYRTLAEHLRSGGFDTAAIANHVFLARPYGFQQGFTHYDDSLVRAAEEIGMHKTVTSDQVTDRALEWIERKAAARDAGTDSSPWLLWAHYFDPHNQYRFHAGTSEPFAEPDGPDRDLYDGEIAFTDRALGRLLRRLDELGLGQETIVVLVADHGEAFGEHGRVHHSDTLYQELINVPLIVRGPGLPAARVRQPVQVADLMPTLLELAGLAPVDGLDGRSLVPVLRGAAWEPTPVVAEVVAAAYEPGAAPPADHEKVETTIRSLTLGPWKLIEQDAGARELYDLSNDRGELTNVAAEHPERVASMSAQLRRLTSAAEERGESFERGPSMQLSDEQQAALEALGYADK